MNTLSYFVIPLCCLAAPVRAAEVYSGCATPPSTFRNVWYFDPVHGKTKLAGGKGTKASPWNNLEALNQAEPGYAYPLLTTTPYPHGQPRVWAPGPDAGPIAPGDEILLMSGNYGNLGLDVYNTEIANSAFVTIAAAPGQTPILTSIFVAGTHDWAFSGLKVQSLQSAALSGHALVQVDDGGASFPTSNIVFENLTISSQDNVAGWSQAQWRADARTGLWLRGTTHTTTKCISITGSHITNVRQGAFIGTDQVLFSNNQIDHFGNDGLDYAASDLAITHNSVHDNLNIGDGNHEDAMQGQAGFLAPGATVNYFSNVLIDSNRIVRQTDPRLPFPTYLQGIDAFDADWTNVKVTNNVVITSACHGITFASIHNGLIADNTVVEDGLVSVPGCTAAINVGGSTHEGRVSTNTVVRNNLASMLNIDNRNNAVIAEHNVVLCCGSMSWYVNGVHTILFHPGTFNNGSNVDDIIDTGGTKAEFVNFYPTALTYDVLLRANAPAIGPGTSAGVPAVDILGDKRGTPYTVGAYAYPE